MRPLRNTTFRLMNLHPTGTASIGFPRPPQLCCILKPSSCWSWDPRVELPELSTHALNLAFWDWWDAPEPFSHSSRASETGHLLHCRCAECCELLPRHFQGSSCLEAQHLCWRAMHRDLEARTSTMGVSLALLTLPGPWDRRLARGCGGGGDSQVVRSDFLLSAWIAMLRPKDFPCRTMVRLKMLVVIARPRAICDTAGVGCLHFLANDWRLGSGNLLVQDARSHSLRCATHRRGPKHRFG